MKVNTSTVSAKRVLVTRWPTAGDLWSRTENAYYGRAWDALDKPFHAPKVTLAPKVKRRLIVATTKRGVPH